MNSGYTEMADTELWDCIRNNDRDAFDVLFRRMWEPLYLFAYKRLKSKADAEDVVQQVFIALWENRSSRSLKGSFSGYLFSAVRYEVIDQLSAMMKDASKTELITEQIVPSFNATLEKLLTRELDQELDAYINTMPQQMQKIFRLSREEQLAPHEIAHTLSLSEKTVRNQLSLAMHYLRPFIRESLLILLICNR